MPDWIARADMPALLDLLAQHYLSDRQDQYAEILQIVMTREAEALPQIWQHALGASRAGLKGTFAQIGCDCVTKKSLEFIRSLWHTAPSEGAAILISWSLVILRPEELAEHVIRFAERNGSDCLLPGALPSVVKAIPTAAKKKDLFLSVASLLKTARRPWGICWSCREVQERSIGGWLVANVDTIVPRRLLEKTNRHDRVGAIADLASGLLCCGVAWSSIEPWCVSASAIHRQLVGLLVAGHLECRCEYFRDSMTQHHKRLENAPRSAQLWALIESLKSGDKQLWIPRRK